MPSLPKFALKIPPALKDLLDNPAIAKQFLYDKEEEIIAPYELADPIGDIKNSPLPGIVHRYPDRVLLKLNHDCAVHCRFCFRKNEVGVKGRLNEAEINAALEYIRDNPAIWEVILTGGEPLLLPKALLQGILDELNCITHVQIIRIHTRLPIASPGRLAQALKSAKPLYLVIHANHPAELTPDFTTVCHKLRRQGIALFSQSVLLKGVNDDAAILEALFRGLLSRGVKPYYLHQLDLVPGTSHFRVPIEQGQRILQELRGKLSGLALPTYILDIPGGAGKVEIGPNYWEKAGIYDVKGRFHQYEVD